MTAYRQSRYEFFIAVIIIAVIVLVAFDRYQQLAKDARDLGFEIISHHFMKGAADARIEWLLQVRASPAQKKPQALNIAGQLMYFSPQAWPASTRGIVDENFTPHIDDCYGLWMLLLQNPAPISKEGEMLFGSRQYHVVVKGSACRYLLVNDNNNHSYYFDYFPLDGRVILSIPTRKKFQH